MKIKYRNKIYNSEDIPIFLYFKNPQQKKDFNVVLANYELGNYTLVKHLYAVLAGKEVIKDKRAKIYFCIDNREEKSVILKSSFDDRDTDNNAMVCSPPDIPEESIVAWIENNLHKMF